MIKTAVIGDPISHSLSPAIFESLSQLLHKKDFSYEALHIRPAELSKFVLGAREEFAGINVTLPHKEKIIPFLDKLSAEASALGAVNVVRFENESAYGFNTDVLGIKHALDDAGFVASGSRVLILGAGGAARAAVFALAQGKTREILVSNRTKNKAQALVQDFAMLFTKTRFLVVEEKDNLKDLDLILQATPQGMQGFSHPNEREPGRSIVPLNAAKPHALAFDLVYRPEVTPFIEMAKRNGLKTLGGLDMLIYQAIATWEVWFGPLSSLKNDEALARRELKVKLEPRLRQLLVGDDVKSDIPVPSRIFLCGFMGSGKTTIGPLLAKRLGFDFLDTDRLIEERAHKKVAALFQEQGEDAFRRLESEMIDQASKGNSVVISLGGGALTRQTNLDCVKKSGALIHLDATPITLAQRLKKGSEERPLLKQNKGMRLEETISELLSKRLPGYEQASLRVATDNLSPSEVVEALVNILSRKGASQR